MKARHFAAIAIGILLLTSPVHATKDILKARIVKLPKDYMSDEVKLGDPFELTTNLSSPRGQHNPRLAFDGNDTHLVIWEQGTDLADIYKKQIYAARVRVGGGIATVLDASGIPLLPFPKSQQRPRVAFGNGVFLVVWQELTANNGFDIKGVLVDSNGNIKTPTGVNISTQPHNQITPDLVYDSTNSRFFVVWADYRSNADYEVYGARVNIDGTVMDINGIQLAKDRSDLIVLTPTVGTNGTTLIVNWSRKHKDMWPGGMISNLYDLDGNFISNNLDVHTGVWSSLPKGNRFYAEPQLGILSHGTGYIFLFRAVFQTRMLATYALPFFRVLSDGTIINVDRPLDIDKNVHAFSAGAVSLGELGYAVVWEGLAAGKNEMDSNRNIYMARVNSAVTENVDYDNPIVIADTSAAELSPAIAANGTELLVVYEEDNLDNLPANDNPGVDQPAVPQNLRILNSSLNDTLEN
jgi:hypothetical protein